MQHGDMNAGTKMAALNKFRNPSSVIMRQPVTKVLVVYDVQVKSAEVPHVPLIINYGGSPRYHESFIFVVDWHLQDLPKAVEEYSHRFVVFRIDVLLIFISQFLQGGTCRRLQLRPPWGRRQLCNCNGR
jgi:hypothetical protein